MRLSLNHARDRARWFWYSNCGIVTWHRDCIVLGKTEHEMRWEGHSKVHLEWNKYETIEWGVQESQKICESENNKNNKTIEIYGCRREIPMERSGPECITIWFGVTFWSLVFDVQSLEFVCIIVQLSALRVEWVVRVTGHNTYWTCWVTWTFGLF